MALDKEKLKEKIKGLSEEDKKLFLEVLSETSPENFLSLDEVSTIREMLAKRTKKSKGGILDAVDDFFGFGKE